MTRSYLSNKKTENKMKDVYKNLSRIPFVKGFLFHKRRNIYKKVVDSTTIMSTN